MPSRRVPSRSAPPPAVPGEARRITAYATHTVLRRPFMQAHLFVVRQGRLSLGAASAGRGEALLVAAGTEADLRHDLAGDARHEAMLLTFAPSLVHELPTRPDAAAAQVLAVDTALAEAVQEAAAFLQARSVAAALQRQRLLAVLQIVVAQGHAFPPAPDGRSNADLPARVRKARAGAEDRENAEDIRLLMALGLLQTTRLPMATVVRQCGGEHPSRFAAAFTARFGFAPSLLRAGPAASAPG